MNSAAPQAAGLPALVKKWYRTLIWCASHLQSFVLLVVRLAWGWELVESGHGHLTHLAATISQFQEWHIPMPTINAYLAGGTELVGGSLLMLGLASRLISIPLFFNFCVAYLAASTETVTHFFKQDPSKFVDDTAFPFLVTSLVILAFGPGKVSIDYLLKRLVFHEPETAIVPGAAPQG
jgi:putative oxidoreductase